MENSSRKKQLSTKIASPAQYHLWNVKGQMNHPGYLRDGFREECRSGGGPSLSTSDRAAQSWPDPRTKPHIFTNCHILISWSATDRVTTFLLPPSHFGV
ncbi:hypothetical protein LMH87_001728 [Akanthomyces muscarius]|uniref:Uncharacterized protein n=1 Tax=Akanthomyces muscarius TaxID=2231603 RepID=A0A9W8UIY9_AKAMU|nr:hypothetical protein LMH87_001728 [Akanthomyces muscarius]KAJ4147188.1 hypothetical protein LMH87_001728 [Akanthomyces muscarius]